MNKKHIVIGSTLLAAISSGFLLVLTKNNQECDSQLVSSKATSLKLPDGVSLPATKENCDKAVAMANQNWQQYVTRVNNSMALMMTQLAAFLKQKKDNPTPMATSTRSIEQTVGSKTCSLITSYYCMQETARGNEWRDAVIVVLRNTKNELAASPKLKLNLIIDYTQ